MTEPASSPSSPAVPSWIGRAVWAVLLLALGGWTVWRLDLFPISASVPLKGAGSMTRAYFNVDHPFHTARAELLVDAWSSLHPERWIANHQGGYPAEFYPFGTQAIAALVMAVGVGQLATASAWAITIAIIFLLPGVAYLAMGRVDRVTPDIAIVALAGQATIASDWTHGGYTELVEWGLATNVAGFTWALVSLPLIAGAAERRSPRLAGPAALAIAMCAVSNPRALLAVAIIALAVVVDAALRRDWRSSLLVVAIVGVLSAGLAAPVLVPLARYRDFYFFLSYQEYADLGAYWSATVGAVSWPILLLAAIGVAMALLRGARAGRVSAIALLLYVTMTAMLVRFDGLRDLIPQLELPRLMPFQRFLVIWLAAYGTVESVRLLGRVPWRFALVRDASVAVAASVALAVIFTSGLGPFPEAERGLREVPRTEGQNAVDLHQFEDAVALADDRAPDSSAILVIGSRLSWHEQLWAPMVAPERRFYYNDWLWYWHQLHAGPYDYHQGHFYPDPSQALTREYFDEHGIGAVVITDIADRSTGADARQAAAMSPELERVDTSGSWDVYLVRDSAGLVTLDGEPPDTVSIRDDGEAIEFAYQDSEAGIILVRQNWFPRWEATVNGEEIPVERGSDGYIEIASPGGNVNVTLRYGVTSTDIAARVVAAISVVVVVALLAGARPSRRLARR